jgi:hypothetical protein
MRYEDVDGCLGDSPNDPALYRREAHPRDDRPTRAEVAADEAELRDMRRYSDGAR